jgi:hypothetical protein
MEIGGMDFASSAAEIIIKQADKPEWAWVEERVRSRITSTRDWAHEQYVKFLTDGLRRRGKASKADNLIREIGTPEQQTQLLIKEGRIDAAARMLNEIIKDKPGLVIHFADWFLEAKAKDAALRFVITHATGGWREDEWLAQYHRKYSTPQEALDGQKRLFLNHPSVEKFKILRDVCRKTKNWETIRAEVLATLEGAKKFAPLIEIALYEDDVTRALQLLSQVSGWGASDLKLKVAKAAEKELPREAIKLYRERAEREIEGRTRGSYHVAADFLKKVKRLYLQLDERAVWAEYINGLRETHKRLQAFQDELRKADL